MRNRIFGACVVSAFLASLAASLAAAQNPEVPPPLPAPPKAAVATPPDAPIAPPSDSRSIAPVPAPTFSSGIASIWDKYGPGHHEAPADGPSLIPTHSAEAPIGSGRFWVDNEFLMWWLQGTHLPPLVGTSPPGTPVGKFTGASTTIYGPGSQDNGLRLGYRLTVGGYLDDHQCYALEAQFLIFANSGNQFNDSSSGTPILTRPVLVGGQLIADPIAVPGTSNGSIHVSTTTTGWLGGGFWLRENFSRTDDPCDTCHCCRGGGCCGGCSNNDSGWYCRFDSLIGYRYVRLADHLEIDDTVNAVAALNGLSAGSTIARTDRFETGNSFHGADLGITGEATYGRWSIGMLAKVAVGFNDSSVDVLGYHSINNGPVLPGGFLAQLTNIGHYSHVGPSAIPELGLRLAYSVRPNIKVFAGYTMLYWYHVTRASDEVNLNVDPTFTLSGTPSGGRAVLPNFLYQDRSIWVQGVRVGFEWQY
jgi:hypothetical protein